MSKIRVLLADDHTLFREGIAGIVSAQPDMEVVGEAADGLEAVVKARGLVPDLILMDIGMPPRGGLGGARHITYAGRPHAGGVSDAVGPSFPRLTETGLPVKAPLPPLMPCGHRCQ